MPRDNDLPPYAYPAPRPRPAGPGTYLIALLIGFAVGAFLLWAAGHFLARDNRPVTDPSAEERPPAPKGQLDADEAEAVNLFKAVKGSVVNVDTILFRRNWDRRVQEEQTGTGSGFVWDKKGHVVTNFHVVRGAAKANVGIRVVMADRAVWEATVVGVSPDSDVAVLQIAAPVENLQPIKVGRSADLEVGQKAFAIGNPFGLSLTMTKGIISAVDRTIDSPAGTPIPGAIQMDAAINPGNSGGPLLDKDGRLIGMNASIASPSGGNVGIGFAIPVDLVNSVVTELIRHGKVLTPDLGIKLYNEQLLRRNGPRYAKGVMVDSTAPNGPGARAGLQGIAIDPDSGDGTPGDLILAIDGQKVNNTEDYKRIVAGLKIGQTAKLHLRRGSEEMDVDVAVRGV